MIPPHAGGYEGTVQPGSPVPSLGVYAKKKGWPRGEQEHAAIIRYQVDTAVGKVVKTLRSMGVEDNTLIVFSSDNGPHDEGKHSYKFFDSAGPLKGYKRSLYEGGIRVPMIMKWPGKIKSKSKTKEPVAFWDMLPTLAKAGGSTDLPSTIDGVDVSPVFSGKSLKKRPLYWEFCTNKKWGHAIRVGNMKLVSLALNKPYELYNVVSDPGEKKNLAKKKPNIVKHLAKLAKAEHKDHPMWPKKNCHTS